MLIPRRVKHRKQHHPSRKGATKGGSQVAFGDFGIQALAPAYVTNRQFGSIFIQIVPSQRSLLKLVWVPVKVHQSGGLQTLSQVALCSRSLVYQKQSQ
jgi:ribosomal protein L16/L10AE